MVALLGLALGPVSTAIAAPEPAITSPAAGSTINTHTPTFGGTAADEVAWQAETEDELILEIHEGSSVAGPLVSALPTMLPPRPSQWELKPLAPLPDGVYTLQAKQTNPVSKETSNGPAVTFTVDTTPPKVNLTSPANGARTTESQQTVGGSAGTEKGDLPRITVQLFSGASVESAPAPVSLVVGAANGKWAATFGGLAPGTYTAQAEQSDEAGNVGKSGPVTFTVLAPPAPPPPSSPLASFAWFPAAPRVGELVALASTSTDASGPISAFAWDLTGSGSFKPGGPVLTTSFATAGSHVVRLRVTGAGGRESVATETIKVTAQPLVLMQPFPIVRLAGRETGRGAKLSSLTVQAPENALITVTCKGSGCPTKSEVVTAHTSTHSASASSVLIVFHNYERSLRSGAILEIRVSKGGQIGKYTRFTIHGNRLPSRLDECVEPASPKPIVCPS